MNPAAPVMTTRGLLIADFRSGPTRRQAMSRRLVCVLVEEALDDRQPHDLHIETNGPVLDVVEIILDALLERRIPAPAVHLRPPGQPGLHLVPQHVLRDPVLELLDEVRALGPRAD